MVWSVKGARRRQRFQPSDLSVPALFAVMLFSLSAVTTPAGADEIVALVPVVPLDSPSASTDGTNPLTQYAPLITESLRIALTNAGFAVKSVPELTEFGRIWPEANAVDATIAVFGTAAMAEDRLVIQLTAYEVGTKQIITGSMANGRVDLSLYNVVDGAVADLATKVKTWAVSNPLEELRGTPRLLRSLTLEGPDNGEEIYLPGGERLGTVSNGTLSTLRLSVPVGSTLVLEKRKSGYITDRQTIRISKVDERVKLSGLWPATRLATDLLWTLGFPEGGGIGVRYFPIRDWLFVSLNTIMSVQSPTYPNGYNVFHLLAYGGVGSYLVLGPTSHFRMSVSAGAGIATTFFTAPGAGSELDVFISFLNPTFYANFRRFYAFIRPNFWFVIPTSGGLLESGVVGNHGPPPISFGVGYKW